MTIRFIYVYVTDAIIIEYSAWWCVPTGARDKGTKGHDTGTRDKGTKGQRDKVTRGQA